MQWTEFECPALQWIWWASDSRIPHKQNPAWNHMDITRIHTFKITQSVFFHKTLQMFFQTIAIINLHVISIWYQGVPQFEGVLFEAVLPFYLFWAFLVLLLLVYLGFVIYKRVFCCSLFNFLMLFMFFAEFCKFSLISLQDGEMQYVCWPFWYETHIISITFFFIFFHSCSSFTIFFGMGWLELYLFFKMWAPRGFVKCFNNVLCFILYFFSNDFQHSICFFIASEHWTDVFLEISVITTRSFLNGNDQWRAYLRNILFQWTKFFVPYLYMFRAATLVLLIFLIYFFKWKYWMFWFSGNHPDFQALLKNQQSFIV